MTVRARWLAKYNVARLWAAVARRRYMWKPSAKNKAELERRRRQVDYALRVLKRHPAGAAKPIPARGIDVSNNNGPIDWHAVRRAGYRFVWAKAGEGDWKDSTFVDNIRNAGAAGLKVGGYHWLKPRPGRTGAQEAAFFIVRLEAADLGKGDLRPVLDCEDIDPKTKRPRLEGAALREYISSFVKAMHAHGFRPIIYTGAWWWDPFVGGHDFGCPLWVSHYTKASRPTLPKAWKSWACWQHDDKGSVPGIHGNVDLNQTSDLRELTA
jgi:GH25 family lysozyme M1 (1,4-beta-N-acetylmuramidase)